MRLVYKVVIGIGILLVFLLFWFNYQSVLISYAGSRPDIPITINIDNSLSLEDQKADLLVKMQDAANEYGCPENKGSNNALGHVQVMDDLGEDDNFIVQVANIGCNDGTTQILFFKVITPRPHDVDLWNTSGSEIIETYAKYIKETDAKLENDDIHCSDEPTVEELNFTSLKPKRQLHQLYSDCLLSRCHGVCTIPDWLYYTNAAGEVIVIQTYKGFEGTGYEEAELLEDNFGEIFGVLETEQQLDEYITLSPKLRRLSLLDEVFEVSYVSVDDCEFDQEAPEVSQLISQNEDGFVYEGFFVDPANTITLYHFRYSITFDGKITESRELLAECGQGINF